MDPDRARIQADLAGQIDGQVRCDDLFLQMYATDASIYQLRPLGVIRPSNVEDVVACVKYAGENGLSLIPRGTGSNVVGSCLGQGLILDFSYAMRRLISFDRTTVTIQPGMVLADLNEHLRPHGRVFSADPPTRSFTTLGGLLSRNSSGSHWVRNGLPADQVVSLDVVLADGERVRLDGPAHSTSNGSGGGEEISWNQRRARELSRATRAILDQHRELIEASRPATRINQAGYNLFDVESEGRIDLTRLICGSEGSLGIITRAVLATSTPPRHRGVSLLFFHQLDTAARAALEIQRMGAVACDLLDRRLLTLARETHQGYSRLIPADAEAMLLVEFQAEEDGELREKLEQLEHRICRRRKLAFMARSTTQKKNRDQYWRLTRRVIPTLYRLKGTARALPFIEDIAIPPEQLPDFIQEVHRLLNEHEVTASLFAQTPQGLIHIRPFLDMTNPEDLQRMSRLSGAMFDHVRSIGGTISGSNGDGLSRSWYLRRQYGELYNVFSEIKDLFDPANILNPGKIVGHPYSGLTDNLRVVVPLPELEGPPAESERDPESPEGRDEKATRAGQPLPVLQPELNWTVSEMALAARNCNGCGRCRTSSPHERMCPLFRLSPREEASPRAKANLMRGVLTGTLEPQQLASDEFKAITDLCFLCHQCRLECPASVDIPRLMVEAKAQYAAINGSSFSDWTLTRLDRLYSLAGSVPGLTNWMIRSPLMRWWMERLFGLASGRKLPSFGKRTFLRWAVRHKYHVPPKQATRKVVYFVDAYANWNDIELGQAFVRVLEHNRVGVLIPAEQGLSGMALIAAGSLARARKTASRNVEALAEWVRQGYRIVTTEPSAALALRHEYLNLLDDPDAQLVAQNTVDCTTYLLELHRGGNLELNFQPLNARVGYHLPCHQRVLNEEVAALELLRLIPGLQVEMMEKGCSGMAGIWGLKRKNYNRSLRMGFPLISAVRQPTIMAGTTECSACKIQMEQGTTKPTIHPIKILALAYGRSPQLNDLFHRRSKELTVT